MKFKIISHACIYIEHLETRLLIDPWILGSCYWRSWWNYPNPSRELIESLKPTHIYITHLHWDHYHGPSLRKFENLKPKIIFPKHFNKRMVSDCLRDFNFQQISEIDHGKNYKIGDDFFITSYQFNPINVDSSIVIEADDVSILNCNDAKVFGLSLNQLLSNHKKFDFVLRSHSSASPIPHCIRGSNPEKSSRSPIEYANDFISFGKATKGKYLIPFASSHFYLHPKTKKFNKFYSDPKFVQQTFYQKTNNNQHCVLMPSGSSWSKENGFELINHDYSLINKHIKESIEENKTKLETYLKKESKSLLNKNAFKKYYTKFLNSTKFPLRLNFRFGFLINEKKTNNQFLCIIDGIEKKTNVFTIKKEYEIYKFHLSFVIKTSPNIFNDCNQKIMHNTFGASKLLEIILINNHAEKNLNKYLSIIDFYENDCLPISRLFSLRNLSIILKRWREILDIIYYFYIIKIKKGKISDLYSKI